MKTKRNIKYQGSFIYPELSSDILHILQEEEMNPNEMNLKKISLFAHPQTSIVGYTVSSNKMIKIFVNLFLRIGWIKLVQDVVYRQEDIKLAYTSGVLQSYLLIEGRLLKQSKKRTGNSFCEFHGKKRKECGCIN